MKKNISLSLIILVLQSCMFLNIPTEAIDFNKNSEIKYFSNKNIIGPYSSAVKIGNYIFLSGQIGVDPNNLENNSIENETERTLKNIDEVLKNFNYSIEDVVSSTVYLNDLKNFDTMNNIYEKFFIKGKFPARTTIEASELPKNAKIEISVIAFKN